MSEIIRKDISYVHRTPRPKEKSEEMNVSEKLWNDIGENTVAVLSTCFGGRVTSRKMSMVIINGNFYCQTNKDYLKCRQISENPNVSLCFGTYTIEGVCTIKGKPFSDSTFIAAMEKAYPDAVKRWSYLPAERILEIRPALVRSWIYEDDIPYIETWNLENDTYGKERQ